MLNPAGNAQREKRDGHNMLLLNFGFKKKDNIEKLNRNGIKTVGQILEIECTKEGRNKLSTITDIPIATILELVKLSDLARILESKMFLEF